MAALESRHLSSCDDEDRVTSLAEPVHVKTVMREKTGKTAESHVATRQENFCASPRAYVLFNCRLYVVRLRLAEGLITAARQEALRQTDREHDRVRFSPVPDEGNGTGACAIDLEGR